MYFRLGNIGFQPWHKLVSKLLEELGARLKLGYRRRRADVLIWSHSRHLPSWLLSQYATTICDPQNSVSRFPVHTSKGFPQLFEMSSIKPLSVMLPKHIKNSGWGITSLLGSIDDNWCSLPGKTLLIAWGFSESARNYAFSQQVACAVRFCHQRELIQKFYFVLVWLNPFILYKGWW